MGELLLGENPRSEVLRRLQALLVQRFGDFRRSTEDRHAPEWVLVQGLIGARTHSDISNATTDRLLAYYGSWEAVAEAPLDELQAELTTQTFPGVAAKRLKDCFAAIIAERGAVDLTHLAPLDTETAMEWLERQPGVGRKIAAQVMNTSVFQRAAIVLDSHHRRILQRMGLVPPKADSARTYDAIMPAIPLEWDAATIDEHRLLMKGLGRAFCRPAFTDCAACPAQALCATGRTRDLPEEPDA